MSVFTDPYQDSYPPSLWGGGPASTVASISPSTAAVGAAAFTLTVTGTGFSAGSDISFDGDPRVTNFISETQLTCSVATITGVARTVQVTVSTGGSRPFVITAVQEEESPEPEAEPEPESEPEPEPVQEPSE